MEPQISAQSSLPEVLQPTFHKCLPLPTPLSKPRARTVHTYLHTHTQTYSALMNRCPPKGAGTVREIQQKSCIQGENENGRKNIQGMLPGKTLTDDLVIIFQMLSEFFFGGGRDSGWSLGSVVASNIVQGDGRWRRGFGTCSMYNV